MYPRSSPSRPSTSTSSPSLPAWEGLNSSLDGGGTTEEGPNSTSKKCKHRLVHVVVSYHLSAESGRELSFEKLAEKQPQSGGDEEDKGARGGENGWKDEEESATEETHSKSKEACIDNIPSQSCMIEEGCCVSDTVDNIPTKSCGGLDWSDEAQAGGGGAAGHAS